LAIYNNILGLLLYMTDILGQNFTLYKPHWGTPPWSVGKCQKTIYFHETLHTAASQHSTNTCTE